MAASIGSIVRLNTQEPYWRLGDPTSPKEYHEHTSPLVKGGKERLWKIVDIDSAGNALVQAVDGKEDDWVSLECLEDVSSPRSHSPSDELLRKYADHLDKAIASGTMVPKYSSLGIFAEFAAELKRLGD